MSSGFVASEAELALVSKIFVRAGSQLSGVVTGDAAVEIFATKVGLPPDVLSTIWNLADDKKTGNLTRNGVAVAVRLMGWAQKGERVTPDLVYICANLDSDVLHRWLTLSYSWTITKNRGNIQRRPPDKGSPPSVYAN